MGLENGCDGGETAVIWLEEVKRSRLIEGKMTEKTYEKTWFFWQNMTKKHQNEPKRTKTRTKSDFFEKICVGKNY